MIEQEQQAMNWYWAEVRENEKILDHRVPHELREPPPSWLDITEGRRKEIRARVRNVLEGEVRRSEMGPGDLVVFHGHHRMRDNNQVPPCLAKRLEETIISKHGGKEYPAYEIQRYVWWDCLEPDRDYYSTRLFGSHNVGSLQASNLQVAGTLVHSDQEAYLNSWHVTVGNGDPELMVDVERLFTNAVATAVVGDMPQATRKMLDLWREPQIMTAHLPPRQNFAATIDFFGVELGKFCSKVEAMHRDTERDPFRIWLNFEGWRLHRNY